MPKRVSFLVGEAHLAGCVKVWVGGWSGTQTSSDYAQGVIQDTVYETSVSAATPNWWAVSDTFLLISLERIVDNQCQQKDLIHN